MTSNDSIFALATAPGKSGVAVVRISGPQAREALIQLSGKSDWKAREAVFCTFKNPAHGAVIDRGLAIYFAVPASFTGEDVVELQLHGSPAVIREVLGVLSGLEGLRPAQRGEFTRRAFINGKMDLMEAEGLADLINAETSAQKTQAMRQFEGQMSGFYEDIRKRTIHALALMEAYIDFPDEEIPESVLGEWKKSVEDLRDTIAAQLSDNKRGERLRDGFTVVILGAPNAGKSSLLNALAKRDAAIVSTQAGTTRDVIEVHLDIAGYPVVLMDTAGIRDATDKVEEEGIRRALARAAEADIKLVLFDGASWPEKDAQTHALIDDKSIIVVSKSDLLKTPALFPISTVTGQGIEQLLLLLEEKITGFFSGAEAPFITQARHRAQLLEAETLLAQALSEKPLELTCEELRRAALSVGKITGKIEVDDVLDVIFRQFCIGK